MMSIESRWRDRGNLSAAPERCNKPTFCVTSLSSNSHHSITILDAGNAPFLSFELTSNTYITI